MFSKKNFLTLRSKKFLFITLICFLTFSFISKGVDNLFFQNKNFLFNKNSKKINQIDLINSVDSKIKDNQDYSNYLFFYIEHSNSFQILSKKKLIIPIFRTNYDFYLKHILVSRFHITPKQWFSFSKIQKKSFYKYLENYPDYNYLKLHPEVISDPEKIVINQLQFQTSYKNSLFAIDLYDIPFGYKITFKYNPVNKITHLAAGLIIYFLFDEVLKINFPPVLEYLSDTFIYLLQNNLINSKQKEIFGNKTEKISYKELGTKQYIEDSSFKTVYYGFYKNVVYDILISHFHLTGWKKILFIPYPIFKWKSSYFKKNIKSFSKVEKERWDKIGQTHKKFLPAKIISKKVDFKKFNFEEALSFFQSHTIKKKNFDQENTSIYFSTFSGLKQHFFKEIFVSNFKDDINDKFRYFLGNSLKNKNLYKELKELLPIVYLKFIKSDNNSSNLVYANLDKIIFPKLKNYSFTYYLEPTFFVSHALLDFKQLNLEHLGKFIQTKIILLDNDFNEINSFSTKLLLTSEILLIYEYYFPILIDNASFTIFGFDIAETSLDYFTI